MRKNRVFQAAITILVIAMLCVVGYAKKDKVKHLPEAVQSAIQKLYPDAEIREFKKEKEGPKVYEVELTHAGRDYELMIAKEGTVMEEETEIALDDLPETIKQAILKAVPGAQIQEAEKETTYWIVTLQKLETPKVSYEAEVKQNGQEMEIELDEDGNILKQEVEDKEEDNREDKT